MFLVKMGQGEVLDLLRKERGWLSTKQITKKLGITTATPCLNSLLKQKVVIRRKRTDSNGGYQWRIKL